MLYSPVPASRVPLILHLASQGNYVPLTYAAVQYRMNLVSAGSNGMYPEQYAEVEKAIFVKKRIAAQT